MWNFFVKDVKVLWRDRTELMVMFLMPFVLMTILGFALQGVMGGSSESFEMEVALVVQDEEEEGKEKLEIDLSESQLPEQARSALLEVSNNFSPASILDELLTEDLQDQLSVTQMREEEAKTAIDQQEIDAMLIIPDDFTYDTLKNMLLGEEVSSTLKIVKGPHANFSASIFHTIIEQFSESFNLEAAITKATGTQVASSPSVEMEVNGETLSVTERDPVSSMEYYTIGMAAMFAFFTASTIASKAFTETQQQVFSRILISGKRPSAYLSGKALAVFLTVLLQLGVLFSLSSIIFGSFRPLSIEDMIGMTTISIFYALAIAGIGALLTTLTVKYQSNTIAGVFSGAIVSIFALLGGSFIPTAGFPEAVQKLGDWTPNGMAMNAYMQSMQGLGADYIITNIWKLSGFILIMVLLSLVLYPRKKVGA
ncbi:ABC transporter permease [Saliterribacillus persicus]|uniref:ABC-2 type transport system permease protein n=1 Tax=Saliterribacillus persicus TaxID=930114 RepID=A0A368Y993_9BACI|nr:ABC transporter permease [Saliterribacillus persicus]RCW76840.1 ABC-2 type transport system permease protein [Saliterribacillus persicus]